jgi:AcrR family transcriptional regulator
MSDDTAKSDTRIVNIDGRDRRPWALKTRQAILDAAVHEIAERGFERARLVDIADRADVTVGSIYTWFRDKADLFTAALEHTLQRQREDNVRVLTQLGAALDSNWMWKIAAMVPRNSEAMDSTDTQKILVEAIHASWQSEEARQLLLPQLRALLALYRDAVNAARADGSIDKSYNQDLLALLFMAIPVGLSALSLAGIERPARDIDWLPVYAAFDTALRTKPEHITDIG